ncbi:MAG TPA: hypothetical protein VHJ20_12290 [Polyangia bacterium]|nr:hypothetical protein [Polyangia bacterium]
MRSGKLWVVAVGLVGMGCATAGPPSVVTAQDRRRFDDVVAAAEASGVGDSSTDAARKLADAKSDFEYAQHIPLYPERAKALVAQAISEGEASLELARAQQRAVIEAEAAARREMLQKDDAVPAGAQPSAAGEAVATAPVADPAQ